MKEHQNMVGSHRTDEDYNPSNPVKARNNSSLVIAVRETNSWSNSWMVRFGGLDCCAAASVEGRAGRSQRDHALSPLQHRGPVFSRARAVAGVCGVCDTLPGMDCCVLPLQCQDQIVPDCQDYQTPPYVDSWLQQMQVRVSSMFLFQPGFVKI